MMSLSSLLKTVMEARFLLFTRFHLQQEHLRHMSQITSISAKQKLKKQLVSIHILFTSSEAKDGQALMYMDGFQTEHSSLADGPEQQP